MIKNYYYNIFTMKFKSGSNFTLLLTDRGEVYSWGKNEYGQLGISTIDENYHEPTKINFSLGIPIRYISARLSHAAAIDFEYNVYIWGSNKYGELGLGDNVNRSIPTIIKYLTEKKIEKIYCAFNHTFALTHNGEVYSWGDNGGGKLGTEYYNVINVPAKIKFLDSILIKKIYIGNSHAFAIDTSSKIYSWGNNYYYQLCNGDRINRPAPDIANMLCDLNVGKIICMRDSTIILADNKLYSIGYDDYGELGLGIRETNDITLVIEGIENIWGNWNTIFCKMINGDLYAWGANESRQLDIGNIEYQDTPLKLNVGIDIKSINYNRCIYAITTSGEIYTWGLNELVSKEYILKPTLFTYFPDNDINIKYMNRTKSARKNDYYNLTMKIKNELGFTL